MIILSNKFDATYSVHYNSQYFVEWLMNTTERYTSKIIKVGALLGDTKTMLAHWDQGLSPQENLARFQRENIFGKASRSRVEDILVIFRQRYLENPQVLQSLLILVHEPVLAESLDRILFFLSARSDAFLHDAVTEFLFPLYTAGERGFHVNHLTAWMQDQVAAGKTTSHWAQSTINYSARQMQSALRDFSLLQGAVKKSIASAYLPLHAFVWVAFYIFQDQPSGERLINHPEWRLFLLSPFVVERILLEAHQYHLLEYYAAGSMIRVTFPANSLEEYTRVIAERAHQTA